MTKCKHECTAINVLVNVGIIFRDTHTPDGHVFIKYFNSKNDAKNIILKLLIYFTLTSCLTGAIVDFWLCGGVCGFVGIRDYSRIYGYRIETS